MEAASIPDRTVILIIEDDTDILELLSIAVAKEGWKLVQVKTCGEGLDYLKKARVNCILLDIMPTGMDGLRILKTIREIETCRNIPIIMSAASGEESGIIAGLEFGADDYVIKPYSLKVLVARIRTSVRKLEESRHGIIRQTLETGKLKLDACKHTAFHDGSPLDLGAAEFAILRYFLLYPDIVFTHKKIISVVKGNDRYITDHSVDAQILSLKRKLKEAGGMIETVRGIGYRFRTAV